MTQPGRAAIEIVGDASKLGRQLERDAQRAIDSVDLDTTSLGEQISDGITKGVDGAKEALGDLEAESDKLFAQIREDSDNFARALELDAQQIADAIGVSVSTAQGWIDGLTVPIERNRRALIRLGRTLTDVVGDGFEAVGETAEGAAEVVKTGFLKPMQDGFSNLGTLISSAGASLLSLATTAINPATLVTLTATIGAFTLAIPVILGVAAALADLVGLVAVLPAAIGAAASAMIVGTVAFQGFGDAIKAVVKGDPEVIAEALKALAPAAREVVKEFQAMLPVFRRTGDSIQQEFFEPLVGITTNIGKNVLPRLRNELDALAQAMGRAFGHFGDLLTDTENIGILERLLASTTRITDELGAAFASLGQSFLNAIDAGLPSLETLTGRLADALNTFARFIDASIEDGSFQEFLDDAIATLDELLALGGAVGELLGVLFGGTDDAGRGFIGTLTDVTQRMTEFFKSVEGQDALQDFSEIIGAVGILLGVGINITREFIDIFTELDDAIHATGQFFSDLGSDIAAAWESITGATSSATSSVGDFFSDLWEKITAIWDGIVDGVSSAVDSVIEFVSSIPDRIFEFLESIPDRWMAFWDGFADIMITAIGFAIGAVIVLFTDLPGQVSAAVTQFIGFVATKLEELKAFIANFIHEVIVFFQELPMELGAIGAEIVAWGEQTWNTVVTTIGEAVGAAIAYVKTLPDKFREFFAQAYLAVRERVAAVVAFVKGIPGQIISALADVGNMLYSSGQKIINGLISGISSRIGQLRQKIVDAVQMIRDHLPFSPAKTGPLSGQGSPQIAGAVIAQMIAAGLEAGTPLITAAANRAAAAASPFGAIGQAGVTPLTNPGASATGNSVLSPTSATGSRSDVIIVQVGDEQVEAIIDRRVDERVDIEVRRLLAGSRGF